MSWKKDVDLIIFDELHKYRTWKNYLKGVIDQYKNKPKILVTGSARLEVFRKSGDVLISRTYTHRLHPIDVEEGLFCRGKNFSNITSLSA